MALFHCNAETHSTVCAPVPVAESTSLLCYMLLCPSQRMVQRLVNIPGSSVLILEGFLLGSALGVVRISHFVGSGPFL